MTMGPAYLDRKTHLSTWTQGLSVAFDLPPPSVFHADQQGMRALESE